jgi:LPS export ABC transporter protein LptC
VPPVEGPVPEQRVEGGDILFTSGGRTTGLLEAEVIEEYGDVDSTAFVVVTADFYDDEGKHASVLSADYGYYRSTSEAIGLFGHVVVRSNEGGVLYTSSLFWDPATERIHTDDRVTLVRGSDRLRGIGLTSDRDLTDVRIHAAVSGITEQEIEEIEEEWR